MSRFGSALTPASGGRVRRSAVVVAGMLATAAAVPTTAGAATPAASSCADRPAAVRKQREPTVPVVLVPGITGSQLRDRHTGEVVWGTGPLLISPQDGGYALALPIGETLQPGELEPRFEAFEIVEEMGLAGLVRKEIFLPILRLLKERGYRRGDLAAPRPDDTVFSFPYDWRLSNVRSARHLLEQLEGLRAARQVPRLEVDLICQSNGAHICRYLLKYGGASLEQAEAGEGGLPSWLSVRKLILVGTSNGGSLRILRELDRGRNYIALIGRRWQPETTFTFPSVYQDLPVYRRDLFLDADGAEVEIDLFDPETWRRNGWSVWRRDARRRIDNSGRKDLFGDEEQRFEFLRRSLDQARRFHDLLIRDTEGFGSTQYYFLQSDQRESPEQAVLLDQGGERRPVFTRDRELKRLPELHRRVSVPGDGHATIASQMWLSPQEKAALAGPPVYLPSAHMELLFDPGTLSCLAEFLDESPTAAPSQPAAD